MPRNFLQKKISKSKSFKHNAFFKKKEAHASLLAKFYTVPPACYQDIYSICTALANSQIKKQIKFKRKKKTEFADVIRPLIEQGEIEQAFKECSQKSFSLDLSVLRKKNLLYGAKDDGAGHKKTVYSLEILNTLASSERSDQILFVFQEKLVPNQRTFYNTALVALCNAKKLDQAYRLFQYARIYHSVTPSLYACYRLIQLFQKAKRVDVVEAIFADIKQTYVPNAQVYQTIWESKLSQVRCQNPFDDKPMAVIKEMTELNIFPTEKMFVKLISHLIDQTKDQECYRNLETDTRRLNDIEQLLRDTYGYAPNCIDLDTHHRPNRLSQVLWKRWLRARIQISGHLSAFQLASRLIFVSSSHARPSEKAGVCMQSWVTIMPMSPKTTSFELNHRSNLVRKIAVPYSPYVQLAIECGAMGAHSATLAAWKMIPLHVKPPVEALRVMIAATDPESLYKLWQSIPLEYKKQDIILLAFLQSGLKHKNLNAQFVDDVIKLSGPIVHKRVWQRTLMKVYAAINQPEKLLEVILAHAGNRERCRNTSLYIEPLSAIRSVENRAFAWHVVVRLFQLPAIRRDQELVNALLNLSKRCLVSSELSLEDIDKQFNVHPTPATTNPVAEASICMSADRVQPKAFS